MRGGDPEQYLRRTVGLPALLFPVLERVDTDAEERGELRLTELESGPERRDVRGARVHQVLCARHAPRLLTPRHDGLHFLHALGELVEQLLSHDHCIARRPPSGGAGREAPPATGRSACSSGRGTAERSGWPLTSSSR